MEIRLRKAEERDRLLIKNLFNLYQNDLSVYCGEFAYLDENGYFAPDASNGVLPYGDGAYPYLITEDGRTVGFVLVTDGRYAPVPCTRCVQELYLIRAARGRGIAAKVLNALMDETPGRWCLEVYEKNAPARSFWDRLLSARAKNVTIQNETNSLLLVSFDIEN